MSNFIGGVPEGTLCACGCKQVVNSLFAYKRGVSYFIEGHRENSDGNSKDEPKDFSPDWSHNPTLEPSS